MLHPPSPTEGWASVSYTVTAPALSTLQLAIYKAWGDVPEEDGIDYRIIVQNHSGEELIRVQDSLDAKKDTWSELDLPLSPFLPEDQIIQIDFQVYAQANFLHDHVYWANPRLTTEEEVQRP